ncbi:hypothetical protein ES703_97787 [subsurface metagenome]
MPARLITIASHTVAVHTPMAPASTWSFASSTDFCTLMCGRSSAGIVLMRSAMKAMLRLATSRSRISAGVTRSCRFLPMADP